MKVPYKSRRSAMYSHSSSAQRTPKRDVANARGLTLVEARRTEGTVALRVDSLSKRYGAIDAVTDVSFDVRRGSLRPSRPQRRWQDHPDLHARDRAASVRRRRTSIGPQYSRRTAAVRQIIGVAPQEIALYPMLTGVENLCFFGRVYGVRGGNSQGASSNCSTSSGCKPAATIAWPDTPAG